MAKGVYIGAPNFTPVSLPSGYTQLEYIQSSGTQYIDTRLLCNKSDYYELEMEIQLTNNSAYAGANGYMQFQASITGGAKCRLKVVYQDNIEKIYVEDALKLTKDWTSDYNGENVRIGLLKLGDAGDSWYNTSNIQSGKIYSVNIKKDGIYVRKYIPSENSSGILGLFDTVNSVFYKNSGSGTFTAGATYAEVAHTVKKIYLGINNIARNIIKGYIGDASGVARLIFAKDRLSYYGKAANLATARYDLAATTIGNYAIFAGGRDEVILDDGSISYTLFDVVDTYDKSLTHRQASTLSSARYGLAATAVGNYALFGGGRNSTARDKTVDAYNTSLTRSSPAALSTATEDHGAATAGNYALFSGGTTAANEDGVNTVNVYNASLTKMSSYTLKNARYITRGISFNNCAVFAGGINSSRYIAALEVFDSSLTRSNTASLSTARTRIAAAKTGNYVLFGGGYTSAGFHATVDAFNKSFTRTIPSALTVGRSDLAGASLGTFAIFAGGKYVNKNISQYSDIVESYDESLTLSTVKSLSKTRTQLASATIDKYALFAGGGYGLEGRNTVDVYKYN